jgi:hypothetical protein
LVCLPAKSLYISLQTLKIHTLHGPNTKYRPSVDMGDVVLSVPL